MSSKRELDSFKEITHNGMPIDWASWATLTNITPRQAARLSFCIDPIKWPGDNYANGSIPSELQHQIAFKEQQLDALRGQWSLIQLVEHLMFHAPQGMADATRQAKQYTVSLRDILSNDYDILSANRPHVNQVVDDYAVQRDEPTGQVRQPLIESKNTAVKEQAKKRTRKTNLRRAIECAVINLHKSIGRKPSINELWQYFENDSDETGFIEDYTDTHLTWRDTKGKVKDIPRDQVANHLSRIKV